MVTVARSLDFVPRVRGTTDELLQRRSYRTVCNSENSLAVTCGPDWRGDGVGRGGRIRSCPQESREELEVRVEAHVQI